MSKVQIENIDNIAVLSLGSADEKIVVLNEDRMGQLEKAIESFKSNTSLKGVVIIGNTASSFCAGADVQAILGVDDLVTAEQLARRGQMIFQELSELPVPKVAAIGGACVGGGCEMALACDYRVLLDSEVTRIGLPEVKLGILPGFGGCQRLPRLVGLPAALDVILKGKVISAKRAKSIGLADALVKSDGFSDVESYNALKDFALSVAKGKKKLNRKGISLADKFLSFTGIGRSIIKKKAQESIMRETKGKYPAPLEALRICSDSLAGSLEDGLREEAKACGTLLISSECKSLVHIYLLTESAKKLGKIASDEIKQAKVGVVGGGVMGAGIAASCLEKGFRVVLSDLSDEARNRAKTHIQNHIEKKRSIPKEKKSTVLQKLLVTGDTEDLIGCNFVIEAIVENIEVKKKVFENIASVVGPSCILASNTSSLSISKIAESLPNPERFVGMHFFNPAEKMPLVEVVRGANTSNETVAKTAALATKMGKFPVVAEDVPGFLVNRILSPYIAEAGTLLSEGYKIEDIDAAAIEFGMPMGPIRLLDEVGLDVAAKVQEEMIEAYGERMKAPDFLKNLLEQGRLGKKSGLGFYKHEGRKASVDSSVYSLVDGWSEVTEVNKELIAKRLVFALLNEAVFCFDEEVAGRPGVEAAGQVDLATVMGMGFAPFRGGALHYANSLGAEKMSTILSELKAEYGARFEAHAGVTERAKTKQQFNASF